MTTDHDRHDLPTLWLHWLTAAAVLAAWGLGSAMDWAPRGPVRETLREAHVACGLLVLAAAAARLVWRPLARAPVRLPSPRWVRWAEKTVKTMLYVLPPAVALLGIAMLWAKGRDVAPFGLVLLPTPWLRDRALGHALEDLHAMAADGLLLVVGLHAAASLLHGLVLRDGVLAGMLPARRRRPAASPGPGA
ncbi:cytochrome b [Falsiroseomonas ponticola]|uniref:cytochrome b n=1 Tax=Falsiroseomonas ponticola TaxID=2786951 RepID=UPI0019325E39|nr:cytochrome b/b6 domain-containing protein [Roseomonas ponticola]